MNIKGYNTVVCNRGSLFLHGMFEEAVITDFLHIITRKALEKR